MKILCTICFFLIATCVVGQSNAKDLGAPPKTDTLGKPLPLPEPTMAIVLNKSQYFELLSWIHAADAKPSDIIKYDQFIRSVTQVLQPPSPAAPAPPPAAKPEEKPKGKK